MAQRKQLTWTELRVGVFVLIGLAILAVGIFYITGAGSFGPKYRLLTYLPEVEQVTVGAPVSLDGVEIGNVESIHINPKPEDAQHNIQLVLRIGRKYAPDIRSDSTASLVTAGLLGNRYVQISRGLTGSEVPNNGVLPGKQEVEMKDIMGRVGGLADQLNAAGRVGLEQIEYQLVPGAFVRDSKVKLPRQFQQDRVAKLMQPV